MRRGTAAWPGIGNNVAAAKRPADEIDWHTPEAALLRQEQSEELRRALAALSLADRRLFYRKYYYLQSTAQIAAEYGTTERAIEGRLYRIRKRLQKHLGGD